MPLALSSLQATSWATFGLGVIVLVIGLGLGIFKAPAAAKKDKKELTDAKVAAEVVSTELQEARNKSLNEGVATDTNAIAAATASSKTAVEQISGAIASLPEYQRFPGLLVLLGAALMGIATVQFGGTSLF
jgi:hypothetical protein